jgi:ACS family tartrate transporter-like MFS transporter
LPANPLPINPAGFSESAVIGRLTRRLVPFLFLLYIVAYLDRINVGFAKLQMAGQLHFSEQVYGLGAGMFFAGYFFFQVPSNLILGRIGARRWISVLMIVWGVISGSMMLVTTPRSFYVLRFLLGLAEAGFFPGMILYLRSWFPASARASTVALFMTAGPLSGVIGGPLSGAILTLGHGGLAGWQWLFLLEAVPAVVLGIVVFFFLADRPSDARWLSTDERQWLATTLLQEQTSNSSGTGDGGKLWWSVFLDTRVWLLALVYFCLTTCSYGISLWLPSVVKHFSEHGTFVIGLLSAIPYLAATVGMVVSGHHSDRTGERRWHVAGSALLAAAAFFLAASSTSTVALVAAISISVLGINGMLGPFWAMPSSFLTGVTASPGIAFINSIGNLGGFFGPYILGVARTSSGNFSSGLFLLAAVMATGAVLTLLVKMPGRLSQA